MGVSYHVTLAVGKEVCSLANTCRKSSHHATPVPVLHILAEIIPACACPTESYSPCVGKSGVDWKHMVLLLVVGVVV